MPRRDKYLLRGLRMSTGRGDKAKPMTEEVLERRERFRLERKKRIDKKAAAAAKKNIERDRRLRRGVRHSSGGGASDWRSYDNDLATQSLRRTKRRGH